MHHLQDAFGVSTSFLGDFLYSPEVEVFFLYLLIPFPVRYDSVHQTLEFLPLIP